MMSHLRFVACEPEFSMNVNVQSWESGWKVWGFGGGADGSLEWCTDMYMHYMANIQLDV